jgi:homopolymeric O-antigen transport system ATP-binding protein
MDSIVICNATKQFRKTTAPKHHTTFKTELVRWFRGERRPIREMWIDVLRGINLTVRQGTTVGIIGRNGAGKSTLLKLITGIYSPTTGTVTVNGRISALLDLGAGFHPDFSGRENILINSIILGMSRAEVRARMPEIIAFSELGEFIDEPVRTYSSGMYMRLAFSVATHVDPDILIIDEILAVGDEHFSHKSRAKMDEFQKNGKTIVLVTHDLATVERWCQEAAWIDAGKIRVTGDPSMVVSEYRRAIALEERSGSVREKSPESERMVPVQIERVQLASSSSSEPVVLGPEDPLQVRVDFSTRNGAVDVGFRIKLSRSDGLTIYEASTLTEPEVLPRPLPSSGTLQLQIERLGLAAGTYLVDAMVESAGGQSYGARIQPCTFRVDSDRPDRGIINLPHRWMIGRAVK